MSHTQGPWEWSGPCKCDGSYHIGTIGERGVTGIHIDDNHSMRDVVADVWCDLDEAQANARLIAAAPDLLEALKAIRSIATTHTKDTINLLWVVERANKAIQKARA